VYREAGLRDADNDRMQADPDRAISLEDAFDAVRARHRENTKMSA